MPNLANPSSLIPFVVGLCGNIAPDTDEETARSMLRAIWSRLDSLYPSSPKILLTGLANDFGRIAAEEAVQRPGWRVASPLPVNRAAFIARLDAQQRGWFEHFSVRAGVNTYELPSLVAKSSDQGDQEMAHLEQASLYI